MGPSEGDGAGGELSILALVNPGLIRANKVFESTVIQPYTKPLFRAAKQTKTALPPLFVQLAQWDCRQLWTHARYQPGPKRPILADKQRRWAMGRSRHRRKSETHRTATLLLPTRLGPIQKELHLWNLFSLALALSPCSPCGSWPPSSWPSARTPKIRWIV